MDSGDLERERGITITSKVTTVEHDGMLLNVVDSPGHSEYVFLFKISRRPAKCFIEVFINESSIFLIFCSFFCFTI